MSFTRNIAFYAAIKPPDHPIPSGDRLIAANLFKALETGGHDVHLASRYICYSKRSAAEYFEDRKEGALAEANRLIAHYLGQTEPARPDLWITYHPYCKAPDWIGPRVSAALGIPYVTVEAARTNQGVDGEWDPWRKDAQAGLKQAARHLWFKPTDRDYLKGLLGGEEKLARIPVFLDSSAEALASPAALPGHWKPETPVLVTAGMMRKGKKLENYRILARVLDGAQETPWNLVLVGGGPEEDAVRDAFGGISSERLHFTGEITQPEVLQWMRASDLFIWPGWKEPIGMVYLEAQLQELPVVATASMGVPLVVDHGETGLLTPEEDEDGMRQNLLAVLGDQALRIKMGRAARQKVLDGHGMAAASARLSEVIADL